MIRYWVKIYITQEEGLRSTEARLYVTGVGYVIEETNMVISLLIMNYVGDSKRFRLLPRLSLSALSHQK
jgi:hypothetical protein